MSAPSNNKWWNNSLAWESLSSQKPKCLKTINWVLFKHQYTAWKMPVFGVILVLIFPYSVRMRENTDQNNPEYGHFLRSDNDVVNTRDMYERLIIIKLPWPNNYDQVLFLRDELKIKDTVINSVLKQLSLEKKVNMNKTYNKQRIGSQCISKEWSIEIFKMFVSLFFP